MRALIVVVSSSTDITDDVTRRKTRVIPEDYRKKALEVFSSVDVDSFSCSNSIDSQSEFVAFVESRIRNFEIIACIFDKADYQLVEISKFGLFSVTFDRPEALRNFQNYFFSHFSLWMNNFIHLAKCYSRTHDWNKFLLPYGVFNFSGLQSLGQRMRDSATEGRFIRELDDFIGQMNRKRTPKQKGGWRSNEVFYEDDSGVFFRAATEQHAEAESLNHDLVCNIEKLTRFGVRIAPKFHFNATPGYGSVFGNVDFTTCHGPSKSVANLSHVNVFPNNYF